MTMRVGYWSLADQTLVSAANFFTTFYLARNLEQEAFGIFALGYAIILLVSSLQDGIVVSPMMVLGAPLEGEQRIRYFSSLAAIQGLLSFIVSFILLIGGIALSRFITGKLLIIVALNVFFYMGQEYFRRSLFTWLEIEKAFLNDVVCYGGQVSGLVLLSHLKRLSWENSLFVVGATSGVALVLGFFQFRNGLTSKLIDLKKVFLENWHYGKWLLGSSLATYTSSQAYLFISAYLLGPAAAGVLRAVQNVFGPTHVLLNGFANFVPQIASKRFVSEGTAPLKELLKKVAYLLLAVMAIYCFAVSIKSETVLNLLYKDQYVGSEGIVTLFAVNYLFATVSIIVGFGLRAIQKTDVIFRAYIGSSIITILASIPLVYFWGIAGAVVGIILSGAFVSLYSFVGLKRLLGTQ